MGQLNVCQHNGLVGVLGLQNVVGLFPWATKDVPAYNGRELRIPLIDEGCSPIAAKQQRFSPEEADAVQLDVKKIADKGIIRKSTSAWAASCVTVRKKDGSLLLCQDYRVLSSCMRTDSGGLGNNQKIFSG